MRPPDWLKAVDLLFRFTMDLCKDMTRVCSRSGSKSKPQFQRISVTPCVMPLLSRTEAAIHEAISFDRLLFSKKG